MKSSLRKLLSAAFLVGLFSMTPAHGVEIHLQDGRLLGASDVEVDGALFDVEFLDGSCETVFEPCGAPGGADFVFNTDQQAEAASIALFDQVVIPIYFVGDPQVSSIDGCTAGPQLPWLDCHLVTPFATTGGSFEARAVFMAYDPADVISNAPFSQATGASANNFVFAVWTRLDSPPPTTYSCLGFEPPAAEDVLIRKPNRVLPLRMNLLDESGQVVTDIEAPVVEVDYAGTHAHDPGDLEEISYAGRGDDGNMFQYDGSSWAFNLSTRGLAPGEYTITAVSGGDYAIVPACEVAVTIQ